VDHGFGDVKPLFVVAHQAAPTDHPAKSALYHPAARDHGKAGLGVRTADDLDDKVEESYPVHQPGAIAGTIGKEVLRPGPTLADAVQDQLRVALALALSDTSAVVRLTMSSRPSVSTAIRRLLPMIFLPPSYPRATANGALTV